jgi:hypothetical protein
VPAGETGSLALITFPDLVVLSQGLDTIGFVLDVASDYEIAH